MKIKKKKHILCVGFVILLLFLSHKQFWHFNFNTQKNAQYFVGKYIILQLIAHTFIYTFDLSWKLFFSFLTTEQHKKAPSLQKSFKELTFYYYSLVFWLLWDSNSFFLLFQFFFLYFSYTLLDNNNWENVCLFLVLLYIYNVFSLARAEQ